MKEIKVSLKVVLPGRTLLSQEECLKTIQKEVITKKGKKFIKTEIVEDPAKFDMHTLKIDNEVISFKTRKTKPAYQAVNLDVDTYKYMISTSDNPAGVPPSQWKRMNTKDRLEFHLRGICSALGGKAYTYFVFDD